MPSSVNCVLEIFYSWARSNNKRFDSAFNVEALDLCPIPNRAVTKADFLRVPIHNEIDFPPVVCGGDGCSSALLAGQPLREKTFEVLVQCCFTKKLDLI